MKLKLKSRVPKARLRTVLFAATPALWPEWPFLPLVRRSRGKEELGTLFDVRGICGRTGHSATVFLTNVFALPPKLGDFLALPKEVFSDVEEMADAGWHVE